MIAASGNLGALHLFGQGTSFSWLPVFDYPLHNGVCCETVSAVNGTQDSSPPWLLVINKTSPCDDILSTVLNEGRECFLQHMGRIHPCRDIFLSSRDIQDPPVDIIMSGFIQFEPCGGSWRERWLYLLWNGPVNLLWLQTVHQSRLLTHTVENNNRTQSHKVCRGHASNISERRGDPLDRLGHWAFSRERS